MPSLCPSWNEPHFTFPTRHIHKVHRGKNPVTSQYQCEAASKKEMNILLKNCLEFVSLEFSVKTVYATWITKFLHRGEGGLYWPWKGRESTSRAITVKHINLHLVSILLHCTFIQTNRKLDRAKAYEARLSARDILLTSGWVGKRF